VKSCCAVLLLLLLLLRHQIEGRENLPSPSTPAVYVANHQSFMVSM
jgi:1-acyl-sn-glycerol-3-phosphate acyltransferase